MLFDRCRPLAAVALLLLALAPPAEAAGLHHGHDAWARQTIALRSGIKAKSKVVAEIPAGTQVRLLDRDENAFGRWWEVRAGNAQGWVLEKHLAAAAADVSPAAIEASARAMAAARAAAAPPELPEAPAFMAPTDGEDRTAELGAYWKAIRSGTVEERMQVCAQLPYSGHTDPEFFRLLNAWLDWKSREADRTGTDVDADVTKCLQGLASSGDPQYTETLRGWRKHRRLSHPGRKVADRSLGLLADSILFNPIINHAGTHVEGRNWATTRVINMIQSGNPQLQREAMRRMNKDPKLHAAAFDPLEAQLLKDSANLDLQDGQRIDMVSWSCKTLAVTRDRKYLGTLRKVSDTYRDNFRLQRNCKGSLDNLLDATADDGTTADPDEWAAGTER
jgi:hypothetical protein